MIDSDCAMAYWGMAMANINNADRAKLFIRQAVDRQERASPREQKYIRALDEYYKADSTDKKAQGQAFASALEKIVYEFPDDIEAKAFLIVQLWHNTNAGIPLSSHLAVNALLDEIFRVEPMHPAHHYSIHLWDHHLADKAVRSAAQCGPSLPEIAHMWHMPGHTYSELKRFDDAAWQMEASARVDHAQMMRDRIMPDQIHNFAHNNEWLVRNLTNVGRVRDAIAIAKNMISMPRHPQYNTLEKRGTAAMGRASLFDTLVKFELWDEMIELCHSPYLEPTDEPDEQLKRRRHLGQAYFRSGNAENGLRLITQLQEELEGLRAERTQSLQTAIQSAEENAARDNRELDRQFRFVVAIARHLLKLSGQDIRWDGLESDLNRRIARQKHKHRKTLLDEAQKEPAKTLDGRIEALEKAISELSGFAAVAKGEFERGLELLQKSNGVDSMYLSDIRRLQGNIDPAIDEARKYVSAHENETQPLALFVSLLWQADKKDDAKVSFEQLRLLSSTIELDSPVFARLNPIAAELGWPADWRVPRIMPTDLGNRPELESLGPFCWKPTPAPEWTLASATLETISLKQKLGRPMILIFYLGHGCLHCAEQIQAFAPKADAFQHQGIDLFAISSDEPDQMRLAFKNDSSAAMPIKLLSDPRHEVFKAYRAFDDFENQPLHATFLIDGNGDVRWQDIGFKPFMDTEFLLKESKRLLSLPQSDDLTARVRNGQSDSHGR
jgi:peroxiredoxin